MHCCTRVHTIFCCTSLNTKNSSDWTFAVLSSAASERRRPLLPHEARLAHSAPGTGRLGPLHLHQPRALLRPGPGSIPRSHYPQAQPQPSSLHAEPQPQPPGPSDSGENRPGRRRRDCWVSEPAGLPSRTAFSARTWELVAASAAPSEELQRPAQGGKQQSDRGWVLRATLVPREAPAAEAAGAEDETGEQEGSREEEQPSRGSSLVAWRIRDCRGQQILYMQRTRWGQVKKVCFLSK